MVVRMGLWLKYTNYTLVYVPTAMCKKDNDNLGGPFTKTLNLLYGREEDRRLVCQQLSNKVKWGNYNLEQNLDFGSCCSKCFR